MITRHIGDFPMIICASPDYVDKRGRPAEPIDLATHSCLHFSGLRLGNVWIFRKGEQTVRVPIVPRYLVNDGISLKDVALGGAGITLLPMFDIVPEVRNGLLVPLLEEWTIGSVPIRAVYPTNKNIASKVRRFIDFLIQRLPKDAISLSY